MAFLQSLVCARHTKIPQLFIFLPLPYGAVTCLSWSTLTEEVQDPGGCVKGDPIKQCLVFVISSAGWALLMQLCATLHKSPPLINSAAQR